MRDFHCEPILDECKFQKLLSYMLVPYNAFVIRGEEIPVTIMGYEFWKYLNSPKPYEDWIAEMVNNYGFKEDEDYLCYRETPDEDGQVRKIYWLMMPTAAKLAKNEASENSRYWCEWMSIRDEVAKWSEYRVDSWYLNATYISRQSGKPFRSYYRSKEFKQVSTALAKLSKETVFVEMPLTRTHNEPIWVRPFLGFHFMAWASPRMSKIIHKAMPGALRLVDKTIKNNINKQH